MLLMAGSAAAAAKTHDVSTGAVTIDACTDQCEGHIITGGNGGEGNKFITVTGGTHDIVALLC